MSAAALAAATPAASTPVAAPSAKPPAAGASSAGGQNSPSAPPPTGVILPFVPLRGPADAWLGDYLADALRLRIEPSGRLALASRDAARQQAARLGLAPLAVPSDAQWTEMGFDTVVVGTVQRVLGRAAVKVRILGRAGDLTRPAPFAWTVDLAAETPAGAVAPLLEQAAAALQLPALAAKPTFPERWPAIQAVYGIAARAGRATGADERAALLAELQPYAQEPGLTGRVAELEALLRLEQAVLAMQGEDQLAELKRAAAAAQRALDEDPADPERRALLGEIHYFLKQDYLAKTEASVARLKNPLTGLAWAVLGLVAGPSTGEGTEHLLRARQAEPFLWLAARAPDTPPFQGGILDTPLRRWAVQHDRSGRAMPAQNRSERAESPALREGIAAFEAHRWNAADAAFRKAADEDEYDYRPPLYELRILIETGRSAEAVPPLRDLQAENPLEVDIQVYLGVALEKSGGLDDARILFNRILQDDPEQPVALYHLGLTAMAAKTWADAIEPLRTLVGLQPRHEQAWLQLGIAQANLEQWAPADEAFRQVLSIDPKSQPAREWRARIRPKLSR
jgi:tetratricopeptide (TPR) repeat protein